MQTIGYAALQVIPSMKGATKSIESELNGPMAGAGTKAGNSWGSGMFASVGRYAKLAGGVILAVATAKGIKGGWDRALNIDAARGKLTGLGHDAKGVEVIMNSALESVRGTAYGLDAAATTAAGAVAAGVKPGQDLTKYLTLSADAASIAGVSMSEMGSIFNKVQTSQKAYTAELNMLADRGIPIYQWLQQEYGVTAEELRKMVAAGKVDSATFYKVIQDNIGGAALSSGDTIRGTIANVWASFSRFGANIISQLLPSFKAAMDGLIVGVDSVSTRVGPAIETAAAWFSTTLVPAVGAAVGWFRDNLLPVIGEVAGALGGGILSAVQSVAGALSGIEGGGGGGAQAVFDTLATAVVAAADAMGAAIAVAGQVTAFLIEHRDIVLPLALTIGGLVAAYKAYQIVVGAVTAVKAAYTTAMTVAAGVQQAYAMGTYGLVAGQTTLATRIAATTGFIVAKTAAMGTWIATQARAIAMNARWQIMLAKQSMANVIASLKSGTAAMLTWIATQARAAAAATASAARSAAAWTMSTAALVKHKVAMVAARTATVVMTAAQWAWNVALSANPIGLIVLAIVAFVGAILLAWKNSETFRSIVTAAFDAVLAGANWLWQGIQSAMGFIGNVIGVVVNLVQGYIGMWVSAFQWVLGVGQSLWSGIQSVMSGIGNVIGAYVNAVRGYISMWVSAFQNLIGIALGMPGQIGGAINSVVSTVGGLGGRVLGALSGAGMWLWGVGTDIMNGLLKGIETGLNWVRDKVSGLGSLIPGWLKSVLGIASPSKVLAREVGQWLLPGVWQGVEKTQADFQRRMGEVVNGTVQVKAPARQAGAGADESTTTSVIEDESIDRMAQAVVEAAERIARSIVDGRERDAAARRDPSRPGVDR